MTLKVLAYSPTLKTQSLVNGHTFSSLNDRNNGYPKSRYHDILDTFLSVYSPIIAQKGGSFHLSRDWSDDAVNTWSWRNGNEYHIRIPGGTSRHYVIIEEAFIMSICHAIAQLVGGTPFNKALKVSDPGQSDYFAASHCMKRMMMIIVPITTLKMDMERDYYCGNNNVCHRTLAGARSIANYFASLDGATNLSLIKEDPSLVKQTDKKHPKSQCRLDTMKRGYLCPVGFDDNVSYTDYRDGSCHREFFPRFRTTFLLV